MLRKRPSDAASGLRRKFIQDDQIPESVLEKWPSPDVLREGFVPFPKTLLRCLPQLFSEPTGMVDLCTVLAIVDYRRANLRRLPSLAYLAFIAGLGETEFEKALERLESKGMIETQGDPEELEIKISGLLQKIEELITNDESTDSE
jgi:hypothetical protein